MRQRIARIALACLALGVIAFGPHVAWLLMPSRTLEVVIVDKTVPFRNYREHSTVPWLLHALKYRDVFGRFLDPTRDYVGFDPVTRTGHDLTVHQLDYADVLFIADTYGVYVGDYQRPGDQAALERSPKIYGGLTGDEASAVEAFAARRGLLIGEFNAFASPTDPAVRARIEAVFGVRWTKWVGRYWPDLQDHNEVPRWVGGIYERLTGRPFDFTGGGLVFVHEDNDIVILRDDEELKSGIIAQERTPAGAAFGFPERGRFTYWMDVLEPAGADVLYEHVVDTTPSGEYTLRRHGLSRRFPAVTKRADSWYFAGDFVDTSAELGSPERGWLLPYRQARMGCGGEMSEEGFFWAWYAPIVSRLLASRAR